MRQRSETVSVVTLLFFPYLEYVCVSLPMVWWGITHWIVTDRLRCVYVCVKSYTVRESPATLGRYRQKWVGAGGGGARATRWACRGRDVTRFLCARVVQPRPRRCCAARCNQRQCTFMLHFGLTDQWTKMFNLMKLCAPCTQWMSHSFTKCFLNIVYLSQSLLYTQSLITDLWDTHIATSSKKASWISDKLTNVLFSFLMKFPFLKQVYQQV